MHKHDERLDEIADEARGWWARRREARPDSAWEVPFPPRAGETVRVLVQRAEPGSGEADTWRAALIRPSATTAYLEVHSSEGPIGALVSLYEHVAPGADGMLHHHHD
jgi:hypothetical protein